MRFLKGSKQEHLDKAAVNERLSDELKQLPDGYLEWQIITAGGRAGFVHPVSWPGFWLLY